MTSTLRPRCTAHPGRDASALCAGCGLSFCRECVTEQNDAIFCQRCLLEQAAATPAPWRGRLSTLALGVIGLALLWACCVWLVNFEATRPGPRITTVEHAQ